MTDTRSLDEIRTTIGAMPFVEAMRIEIDAAGGGAGTASMPLHRDVSFDGQAFAGVAVATVADIAAGAAALAVIDREQMPFTVRVDSSMTASTLGDRLRAEATLRERDGARLVFDVVVRIERSSDWLDCGTAAVTLRVP